MDEKLNSVIDGQTNEQYKLYRLLRTHSLTDDKIVWENLL